MKIAFLNKYQNKVSRGAETFIYELSKRLSKNNQVDVISHINYWKIFRERYDIIVPTNGRFQAIIVRKIAWLTGAKVIISGQSGIGWDDKVNLLTLPNAFVALSDKAEKWAKRFNPNVRVVKIPNGVDLTKFKTVTLRDKDLKPKDGTKTILCVGAATLQKRLDLAINAVAKLKRVNLIIVSSGGELKEQIYNYGLKKLGHIRFQMITSSFEGMPEIYRSADVFTLPSASSEAFGNVLVEAMASGLPVVATNDPIRKEIVGDAGILVDPEDADKYSQALGKALTTNWGEKPRKQAEKFSWDEIAKKYEELFKELI